MGENSHISISDSNLFCRVTLVELWAHLDIQVQKAIWGLLDQVCLEHQ